MSDRCPWCKEVAGHTEGCLVPLLDTQCAKLIEAEARNAALEEVVNAAKALARDATGVCIPIMFIKRKYHTGLESKLAALDKVKT